MPMQGLTITIVTDSEMEKKKSTYVINVDRDRKKKERLPPPFSLANNMWIGPLPEELLTLTFPEQLPIISILSSGIRIQTLSPKNTSQKAVSQCCKDQYEETVSTFPLNMTGITSMLEGKKLPQTTEVFASVLSITFIGVGQIPKNGLWKLFRVRRQLVLQGLMWLKANNDKYYGDISINYENINKLPEDDVPREILSIVRQTTDIEIIDQEADGYVNNQAESDSDSEDEGGESLNIYGFSHV